MRSRSTETGVERGTLALFPGMAAAFAGMGRGLLGMPAAEKVFAAFSAAAGTDLLAAACAAPLEALRADRVWELAVVAMEAAALEAWRAGGGEVSASLGFSIGAYAALLGAGAASVEQVVAMIDVVLDASLRLPGRFSMLAVSGAAVQGVAPLLRPGVAELAAVISPGQLLLAGKEEAMAPLAEGLAPTCLAVRPLRVRWPLHTSLMGPVSEELERRGAALGRLRQPRHPVYSGIDGGRIETAEGGWRLLVDHLQRPQRFDLAFAAARADGLSRFVELGPTGTLRRAVSWLSRGRITIATFPAEVARRGRRVEGR